MKNKKLKLKNNIYEQLPDYEDPDEEYIQFMMDLKRSQEMKNKAIEQQSDTQLKNNDEIELPLLPERNKENDEFPSMTTTLYKQQLEHL